MMHHASGHNAAVAEPANDPPPSERPTSDLAWHTHAVELVLCAFATTNAGLGSDEATRRLDSYGPNELQVLERTSRWHTLAAQFKNVLILILLAATLVSGLLGHTLEAVVIAIIVAFAVTLGFIQEYRADRALEALKKMAAPLAHVIRDGGERRIAARDVVPGDILVLRAGDRVPADGRITRAINLAIDEAALTGESAAVNKTNAMLPGGSISIGDRRNMAYAGTVVTYGRGQAVAVATGMSTEFGRISALVQSVDAGRTPLQENLDRVGAALGKAALGLVALIVASRSR
jgi:Ca2+-transporting ATPase